MKKLTPGSNLTIEVKDKNNMQIIEFQVPYNTKMKNIHKILWQNKLQFESTKQKIIGFQSLTGDALQDYCLNNSIGSLKNHISVRPLYKDTNLQGLNKYKILKCLATGGFSKVYLVRSMHNGQFYAAKFVDKLKVSSDDKKVLIMNEKTVNESANYEFLVKMHQFIETQNFFVFILDYCPGGQLFYLLRKVKRMTEEQARIYFVEILLGIENLHKQGIMYRDLKPENIMIDKTGHVKIADFGLAKYCRQKSYSFCGSIEYMSPEIVTNAGHSFEVDYYCLGALLFELLIGCPPFYDPQLSEYETKKNIAYAQVEFPDDFGLSNQVKDLIEKLLVKNPNQRLGHFGGAKEIMLHPWVGKINRSFIESKQFQVPFPPNLDRFNFDPNEVGMSEDRFTTKIQQEYRLINMKRVPSTKKDKRQLAQKYLSCNKSGSPYRKKISTSGKKNDKKPTHESSTNLLHVGAHQSSSNLKGMITHDLTRLSIKKNLSKNKSPSFVSLSKKQENSSKKSFKSHLYTSHKFYNMKTELTEGPNASSSSNNNLMKKKKLLTESNQIFRDLSNDFVKNTKSPIQKQGAEKLTDVNKKDVKDKNLLKKSSKLKIKKFFNQNGDKNFKYGKLFRQTCII